MFYDFFQQTPQAKELGMSDKRAAIGVGRYVHLNDQDLLLIFKSTVASEAIARDRGKREEIELIQQVIHWRMTGNEMGRIDPSRTRKEP